MKKFLALPCLALATIFCLGLFGFLPAAQAQRSEDRGSVSGVGIVVSTRMPEILRMQMELTGTGKTLPEALEALKKRSEAAQKRLADIAAEKDSIKVGAPRQGADPSEQMKHYLERIQSARPRPGREGKAPLLPTTYSVSTTISADWKLKGNSPEQQLIQIAELKGKVEAADLAGAKEPKTLTPEEQELAEEMEGRRDPYEREERLPPGTPYFTIVVKLNEVERQKLLSQAFAKAKAQATQLGKAAGAELGNPVDISSEIGSRMQAYMERGYPGTGMYGRGSAMDEEDAVDENEIVAMPNSQMTVRIGVRATFQLK